MNTKRSHAVLLTLAALSAVALVGCGANAKTPIGMCYTATGTFSIAQDAIGEAVTMPELEGTKAKTVLKQVSQKGTDGVKACREAAVASNADGVAFALGAINGAAQIGGQIATEMLTKKATEQAARVKNASYMPDEYENFGTVPILPAAGPGDDEDTATAASFVAYSKMSHAERTRLLDNAVAEIAETNTEIAQVDVTTTTLPPGSKGKAVGKATAPGQVKKSATNADSNAATGKAVGKATAPGQVKKGADDVTGTSDVKSKPDKGGGKKSDGPVNTDLPTGQ